MIKAAGWDTTSGKLLGAHQSDFRNLLEEFDETRNWRAERILVAEGLSVWSCSNSNGINRCQYHFWQSGSHDKQIISCTRCQAADTDCTIAVLTSGEDERIGERSTAPLDGDKVKRKQQQTRIEEERACGYQSCEDVLFLLEQRRAHRR